MPGQTLAPHLPGFIPLGQHGIAPQSAGTGEWWCLRALPAPNTIPELGGGPCAGVAARLSVLSASLASQPCSKLVFKVSCLQSVTFNHGLVPDGPASLSPSPSHHRPHCHPIPPKARAMPDSTPTACLPTLSTSQPPQRPPALRGFLDPPPPSGSQPPGGTKSSLTWTGRWPSRLEPTVTAQPSIPCQAAPECVYMIRIKEKEQAREREKA